MHHIGTDKCFAYFNPLAMSTHWNRDKMAANLQKTFSKAFQSIKEWFQSRTLLRQVSEGLIDNTPSLIQIMIWHQTSNHLHYRWHNLLIHKCLSCLNGLTTATKTSTVHFTSFQSELMQCGLTNIWSLFFLRIVPQLSHKCKMLGVYCMIVICYCLACTMQSHKYLFSPKWSQ